MTEGIDIWQAYSAAQDEIAKLRAELAVRGCQQSTDGLRQPWAGKLSVDLRKGALSVNADGLTLIDAKGVCWGIVFPDKTGSYDHAALIVDAVNASPDARAAVIEECARVAEAYTATLNNDWNKKLGVADDLCGVGIDIADAIRALQPATPATGGRHV